MWPLVLNRMEHLQPPELLSPQQSEFRASEKER